MFLDKWEIFSFLGERNIKRFQRVCFQVKSILPGGPAADNGVLQPGDVLVQVNGTILLGATQAEACRVFLSIPVGDPVSLQICRGYPLMIDPNNRVSLLYICSK